MQFVFGCRNSRLTPAARQAPLVLCCVSAALFACALIGCGRGTGGPELATVHGTVTLDDQPLADATVEFQPEDGRPSFGTTDAAGNYELRYTADKPGAALGPHSVRIRTERSITKEDGSEEQIPEKLPPTYHDETELKEEVQSGSNTFNFDLTSD